MREIKFRAWDKINNDWILKTSFYIDGIGFSYWMGIDNKFKMLNEEQRENIELMQFTGLKDKNGKEIYEGDIVTPGQNEFESCIDEDKKYVIEFSQGGFAFKEDYPHGLIFSIENMEISGDRMLQAEVIGNIAENPELLNDAKEKGDEE